jgi:hypothetical protein
MSEPRLRVHRMAGLWETKDTRPAEALAEEESLPIIIFFLHFFTEKLEMHFFKFPNAWIGYGIVPNLPVYGQSSLLD